MSTDVEISKRQSYLTDPIKLISSKSDGSSSKAMPGSTTTATMATTIKKPFRNTSMTSKSVGKGQNEKKKIRFCLLLSQHLSSNAKKKERTIVPMSMFTEFDRSLFGAQQSNRQNPITMILFF